MKKRYLIAGASGLVTAAVATRLLLRPRDVDWDRNRQVIFHADHSRFANVDGITVHYQESGKPTDPVVVLLHGLSSSTLVWSNVFHRLAEAGFAFWHWIFGLWLFGKPRTAEYTIESQARMVNGFSSLGIEQANLIGSSYGRRRRNLRARLCQPR